MSAPILEVCNLCTYFNTSRGKVHAVDNVSFSVEQGKTLGIVGESGCGKSTLGRTILRLLEPTSGKVFFSGENITELSKDSLRKRRRDMQMIFQDPSASLNPRMTVSQIIGEPLLINKLVKKGAECEKRIRDLMSTVGLAQRWYNTYPHQLDGGRRQRIGIARALAVNPRLVVCDEPVSALDVSIQAQILNLLMDLQEERKLTCIFITHDLSVVHHFSDEIAVMYLGRLIEKAPSEELFENPIHPYTKALLSAIPIPEVTEKQQRIILQGEVTSPIDPPDECRFKKRCFEKTEACNRGEPMLEEINSSHFVACYHCHRI